MERITTRETEKNSQDVTKLKAFFFAVFEMSKCLYNGECKKIPIRSFLY